jgi:hypothetical protein
MKKLVWVFGLLLALSFVFPNGVPSLIPQVKPVAPVTPAGPTDTKIVELLVDADTVDTDRINGVYNGLAEVLRRDGGQPVKRIVTTEQWAELQARTLNMAIDTPGKYPDLDKAIEAVFLRAVGTDDAVPANDATRAKLIEACVTVANSANGKK